MMAATYICHLELSTLLMPDSEMRIASGFYIRSERWIEPGRSPFIHGRLNILGEGDSITELLPIARNIRLQQDETFKVLCLKAGDTPPDYAQARKFEKEIGMCIHGKA